MSCCKRNWKTSISSFKNLSSMVELKFLKLKMYAVAFDVEKIPCRTQVLETRVPPFFFKSVLCLRHLLLLPLFFQCISNHLMFLCFASNVLWWIFSSSPVLSVDLKPSDVPLFCFWCSLVDLKLDSSFVSRFLLLMFFAQH